MSESNRDDHPQEDDFPPSLLKLPPLLISWHNLFLSSFGAPLHHVLNFLLPQVSPFIIIMEQEKRRN